jgi:alkylation response protein AidB-like acyl-CoA dehydrogenase
MTFDNVRVPASALLGEENQGWQVIKRALAHERIGGPRYQRALVVARRLERIARERGWWERDGVRTRYVAAEAACQAARLLVYQAIDARKKDLPDDLVVSLARVAIVRSERLVADLAMELLGEEMTMDFTPTPRQTELVAQVDHAVDETGGLDRARLRLQARPRHRTRARACRGDPPW